MKLLFDFLPILFFFIAYFLFDIYIATMVAIATSGLQVLSYWLKFRRVETMQLITFATISILGGATIFFHNPLFFKWKPTIIYWVFGVLFTASQFIGNKPFLQRLMDSKVNLPHAVWQKLNLSWAAFFIILGFANLYVAYHYSTNVWVYFKLIGALGATLIFALAQSIYMMRYLKDDNDSKPSSATGRL
jgi:intracellular septation protein